MGRFTDRSTPVETVTAQRAGRFASRSTPADPTGKTQALSQLDTMFGATAAPQATTSSVNEAIRGTPIARELMEFANATNRTMAETIDFFGPTFINSVLEVAGAEGRVPTLKGAMQELGAGVEGRAYTEEGSLAGDIAIATGEALPLVLGGQQILRKGLEKSAQVAGTTAMPVTRGTAQLTEMSAQPSTARRVGQTLAQTTPTQDVGYTALSVAGGEAGEATGLPGAEFVGMFTAPMAGIQLKNMLTGGASKAASMVGHLSSMDEKLAGEMLAQRMIAENVTADEIMASLRELGPEAIPADTLQGFREILRYAINATKGVTERAARVVLEPRQAGSGQRISDAFDTINAGSLDEYLSAVDSFTSPRLTALYEQSAQVGLALPERLSALLTSGKSSLSKAFAKAQGLVEDMRALGDPVTNFTMIDQTKQILDDQIATAIRNVKKNKARNLIRLKNLLVEEADKQIPTYAEARNIFAGEAAIKDAGVLGEEFFKTDRRQLVELVKSMTQQEKTAYILGAKEALFKKVDNIGVTRNQAMALFGKNGDIYKLKTLFADENQFNRFAEALKRETDFFMTRKAALDNSTTARQLNEFSKELSQPGSIKRFMQSAMSFFGRGVGAAQEVAAISDGLAAEKGSEEFIRALTKAGDILLTQGMNPAKLQAILRRGEVKLIQQELDKILQQPEMRSRAASAIGTVAGGIEENL